MDGICNTWFIPSLPPPPFLIYLFNTSNKISGRNLVSHPFLRRQFIFERIFSPPSTEVAAAVICHLLDNFCHQLAAKSTSAKTKSEDSYVGCLAGWVRAEGPPRLGLLWARPSRSAAHTAVLCTRVPLSVGMHGTYFLGHIRRHHIVINSPRSSAIDQCACLCREGMDGAD